MFRWSDYEMVPKPQSDFAKIFGAPCEYEFRKASRYGGHLRHRQDGGLDYQTALHWVLHHRHGAALRDRLGLPPDEVADLLVRAAAMHPTEKREAPKMDMTKTLREVGEAGFTKMVERYAKTVHPTLTREQRSQKSSQPTTTKAVRSDAHGRSVSKASTTTRWSMTTTTKMRSTS
jgi:hypothetical protein